MSIHGSAIVSSNAQLGSGVEIGPFCVIEDDVEIGDRCRFASGVVIKRGTRIGSDNIVEAGAVLGGDPQHLGAGEQVGDIVIGDHNQFREYVTVHRAFRPNETTSIGSHNMMMVSSHVGHDCKIGDHNIFANNVMLAGHVEVENRNYFGGGAAVHQFCRVGSFTMIGGLARITRDVPPFVMVDGDSATLVGLNRIGLRRAGMPVEQRDVLKHAYRVAFRSDGDFESRLSDLERQFDEEPVRQLITFLRGGTRGFLQDRRGPAKSNATNEPNKASEATKPSEDAGPTILPFRRAA